MTAQDSVTIDDGASITGNEGDLDQKKRRELEKKAKMDKNEEISRKTKET